MIPIKHTRMNEIAEIHANFLETETKLSTYKQKVVDYINNKAGYTLIDSFIALLIANPQKINLIVDKVGEVIKPADEKEFGEDYFNEMIETYKNFADRKSFFNLFEGKAKNQYYSAISMVYTIDLNVCPYCNRSFINTTKKEKGDNYRTCQLDHFYPKSKYPYLALSFYNLIPVCGTCNHLKGKDYNLNIPSPYELESADDLVKFELKLKSADLMSKTGQEIIINPINSDYNVNSPIPLSELYKYHIDVAHEILQKKYIYTDERIGELFSSFPDLFDSEREVKQLLVGNYLDPDDFNKRPLSKLTHDIMVDVGWLKK
jgi:hypothetical protein